MRKISYSLRRKVQIKSQANHMFKEPPPQMKMNLLLHLQKKSIKRSRNKRQRKSDLLMFLRIHNNILVIPTESAKVNTSHSNAQSNLEDWHVKMRFRLPVHQTSAQLVFKMTKRCSKGIHSSSPSSITTLTTLTSRPILS